MDLRVIEQDGQPWFIAADVCKAIGYNMKTDGSVNTTQALKTLSADEVSTTPIRGSVPGRLVNESGLYKLVMRSDKPEAKAFQDWVTRVVLPAIRKDGAYVLGEEIIATGTSIPPKRGMLPNGPKHSAVSASTGAAPASWRATSPAPKTFVSTATGYHGQPAQMTQI